MLMAMAPQTTAEWMATDAVKRPARRETAERPDRTSDVSNMNHLLEVGHAAPLGRNYGCAEETDPRSATRRARPGVEPDDDITRPGDRNRPGRRLRGAAGNAVGRQ